jgi:protein TIF31
MHVYRLREILHSRVDEMYLSAALIEQQAKAYQYSFPSLSALIPNEPYNDLANALNCDLEFAPAVTIKPVVAKQQPQQQQQQSTKQKKKAAKSTVSEKALDTQITDPSNVLQNPEEYDSRNLFNPDNFTMKSMEHLLSLTHAELPKCVSSITFSGFNPPSGNRKLRGDLFYLEIETLEGKTFHVTATADGFYLNGSQGTTFSPNAMSKPHKSHTLLGLLWELSPLCKDYFPKLLTARTRRHPFEVTPVPFDVPKWIDIPPKHSYDANRAEESLFTILGNDPRIQQREWNEEYQSCKELPSGTMDEKLVRDRTLFKIHCDFVDAATRGAKAVVDKALLPINPIDPKPAQVYIQNNIFFSFAVDTKEKVKLKMSNELDQFAHANANNDLKGVRAFNEADIRGIYTLATAIVDYKGYRVIAQSIIPGILQGDQGSKHVYGSIDEGKTFTAEEKYHTLMKEAAAKLRIKEHTITDKDEKKHTLCSPSDCKGIVGSDGRFYVLDLIRTTPRDSNFVEIPTSILRPELIKFYERYNFSLALKEKQKEQQQQTEEQSSTANTEETSTTEQIKIDPVLFNPDVFTQHILSGTEEEIEQDKKDVLDIATYLKDIVVDAFIREAATLEVNPLDGQSLTEAMHEKGINMRYLGMIASEAEKKKLPHLKLLCEQEMLTRVAKHEFSAMLRVTADDKIAKSIELFLNSFLGNEFSGISNSKKKKKKLQNQKNVYKLSGQKGPQITAAGLRFALKKNIEKKYRYDISDTSLANLPSLSTLRSFALKVGLVVACKDYTWNSPNPFDVNDILDLVPVVKHSTPKSVTAHGLLEVGKQQLAMGQFESSFEFLSQAIVMFQQVKGPMNPQVSTCFSYLATILFHASDLPQSILHQHKALIITRRVLGVDSAMTCQIHQLLGMLCHHVGQSALALKHFLRAKYIFDIACGFDHPDLATVLTNLAMMYQDLGDMVASINFLKEALRVNLVVLGETFQTATTYHALAVSYNMIEKYRDALDHEKKSYIILNTLFGKDDLRTKESSNWVNHFAKLAIQTQKAILSEASAREQILHQAVTRSAPKQVILTETKQQ